MNTAQASRPGWGRPNAYTKKLFFYVGNRAQACLASLNQYRHAGALRQLYCDIGLYCIKYAGTDGVITLGQLLVINNACSKRTLMSRLELLIEYGLIECLDDPAAANPRYKVVHFLDGNYSAAQRKAYAERQRALGRDRYHAAAQTAQPTTNAVGEDPPSEIIIARSSQAEDTSGVELSGFCDQPSDKSTNHKAHPEDGSSVREAETAASSQTKMETHQPECEIRSASSMPAPHPPAWDSAVASLSKTLSASKMGTWIHPLRCRRLDNECIVLVAPSLFVRDGVRDDYLAALLDAIELETGNRPRRVSWVIEEMPAEDARQQDRNGLGKAVKGGGGAVPPAAKNKPGTTRPQAVAHQCILVPQRENSAPLNEYMVLRAFEMLGMERPLHEELMRTWEELRRQGAKEGHLDYAIKCATIRKTKGVAFTVSPMAYSLGIIRHQKRAADLKRLATAGVSSTIPEAEIPF